MHGIETTIDNTILMLFQANMSSTPSGMTHNALINRIPDAYRKAPV